MKQETPVKWLIKKVNSKEWQDMYIWHKKEIFQQAKQIEKENEKNIVMSTYVTIKMQNNKLPYGLEYLNKLAKIETEAETYYNKTYGKETTNSR